MSEQTHKNKGPFNAVVSFNGKLAEGFCRLGQFAQFDVSAVALPETIPDDLKDVSTRKILLRRPFSFAKVTPKPNKTAVEIVYCVLGPATLRMTSLNKGDTLSIIGPLGNGFSIPQDKKLALMVAGGMGSPPLENLAQVLTAEQPSTDVVVFAGAKSADQLPFERQFDKISQGLGFALHEFGRYGIQSLVATDDGSAGFKGAVTDCLLDWLNNHGHEPAETIIYACGPKAMLANVAKLAAERKIDCQVSMEEMMACGIGLCQSCAVKCKSAAGEEVYMLCCKDGPVFNAKDVVF